MKDLKIYKTISLIAFLLLIIVSGIFAAHLGLGLDFFPIPINDKLSFMYPLLIIILSVMLFMQNRIAFNQVEMQEQQQLMQQLMRKESEHKENVAAEATAENQIEVVSAEEKQALFNRLNSSLAEQRTLEKYIEKLLSNLAKEYDAMQALCFLKHEGQEQFTLTATYAFYSEEEVRSFKIGEGLSGQVAKNREFLNITNLPKDYITVLSGLGSSPPRNLVVFPILYQNESIGIIEIATFSPIAHKAEEMLMEYSENLGEEIVEKWK